MREFVVRQPRKELVKFPFRKRLYLRRNFLDCRCHTEDMVAHVAFDSKPCVTQRFRRSGGGRAAGERLGLVLVGERGGCCEGGKIAGPFGVVFQGPGAIRLETRTVGGDEPREHSGSGAGERPAVGDEIGEELLSPIQQGAARTKGGLEIA
jgi:hypothetical protein